MDLMESRTFSSPSASIFCGVSATANSARVARLTPASVACADKTTATSSVYGLRCSSSPFGSGLALRNRLNASWTSAGVQGLEALELEALDFEALYLEALDLEAPDLVKTLSDFFAAGARPALPAGRLREFWAGSESLSFDLGRGLRVIFAMIGIY